MRVCILTTSFPLHKGITIGTHVFEQARHLVRLGVHVDVLAPHHKGAPWHEIVKGISVYRFRYMWPEQWQTLCYGAGIPANLRKNKWTKLQLPFLVLMFTINTLRIARKSDLIHAHWSLSGLAGVIAGKILNKPLAVMLHHGNISLQSDPLIKFVAKKSNIVLCNSTYTLSKMLQEDINGKCRVISPGVDIERFHPQADKRIFFSLEPEIPRNRPLILALGRLIGWKGFEYLIDAIGMIHTDPLPYLLMGGRGPLRKHLELRIQQKGLEDRIKLIGHVPYEFIHNYHAAADVLLLPSIIDREGNTEGLGVVLLEALACGTPCIASNVGGIPDIVKDGKNGFLVEPGNPQALAKKITILLENDGLRQKLGEEGRRFVEKNFSWQAKADELLDLYYNLLKK
jgi:glycosyltransferase involved in cell wall biosynthesis